MSRLSMTVRIIIIITVTIIAAVIIIVVIVIINTIISLVLTVITNTSPQLLKLATVTIPDKLHQLVDKISSTEMSDLQPVNNST